MSSITNNLSNICHKWPIFRKCTFSFLSQFQSFTVIGEKCEDVLMIYKPDNDNCAKVWALGKNEFGILGLDNRNQVDEPTQVAQLDNVDIVDIRHGYRHVALLTKSGHIYTWGNNELSQCGNGTTEASNCLTPTKLKSKEKFVSIRCGAWYSMALTRDGKLYAWGSNLYGQIGVGNKNDQHTPVRVNELEHVPVTEIECGGWHSVALNKNGQVFVWGYNKNGQLGNGNIEPQTLPVKLEIDGLTFKAISAGANHTLVLTTEGHIFAFGSNKFGQLGCNTDQETVLTPVKISTSVSFLSIASSFNMSTAVSECEHCYLWGEWIYNDPVREPLKIPCNSFDQVLSNYQKQRSTPQLVLIDSQPDTNPVLGRLLAVFDNEEGSDLEFDIGGKKIYAHRGFLQLCSLYLGRMLSDCWQQNKSIKIADFEYPVFFAYLQYLYTGHFEVSTEEAIQLLTLSHRYLDPTLTERCVTILRPALNTENCCLLYQIADVCQLDSFQNYIVKFISQNLIEVYQSDEYRNMESKFAQLLGIKIGELNPN